MFTKLHRYIDALECADYNDADVIAKLIVKAIVVKYNTSSEFNGLTVKEFNTLRYTGRVATIKMVRERTGLGLKESVDLVDVFRGANDCNVYCANKGKSRSAEVTAKMVDDHYNR